MKMILYLGRETTAVCLLKNLTRRAYESFNKTPLNISGIPADNWNFNQEIMKDNFFVLDGY